MSVRSIPASVVLATVLGLTIPLRAAGAITPEARAVVDRYLEATGGVKAFTAERGVHSKASLKAFGLSGWTESWTARPDKSAGITSIGPFTLREGCDGPIAWRVDQNGKLLLLDGKDLESAQASAYFENEMWLTSDQGGGSVDRVGAEKDSAGSYVVLEVRPPVGNSRRLWFASATGLIERVMLKEDAQTVVSRTLEYRVFAGRRRPYRTVVSVVGMPANEVRTTLDSVWVGEPLEAARFAPPDQAAHDVRYLSGSPAQLPFRYGERHVWLKASVNGAPPEDFLLDTGASITVIDSAYAARRGLKSEGHLQVSGAGAAGGASLSQVDSIVIAGSQGGGIALIGQKAAILSLNPHIEPFFWRPVAGVLGYDFISRFVACVDYDRGLLTLYDPARFHYQGSGTALRLTMAGNIPVVRAKIDSLEGDFRLDVGSGSTVDLHSPFVARHALLSKVGKTVEVTGGGFGGTFASHLCRMGRMEIGPYTIERPLVSLSHAASGGLASEDYAGNIGNQVLGRFRCTFDYEHRVVYLEPGAKFREPDRFTMAGVQLARLGGSIRALQVLPGSAAEAAGVEADDEVTAIDRRPMSSYTLDDVNLMFENGRPGEKHVLRVMRGGKKRTLTLRLKTML